MSCSDHEPHVGDLKEHASPNLDRLSTLKMDDGCRTPSELCVSGGEDALPKIHDFWWQVIGVIIAVQFGRSPVDSCWAAPPTICDQLRLSE